ncbi:hypothetical protein Tco_0840435 [Tanacetum coccineum]|uniref:Uncharacterized protein n=1 Tax=Tanacetum coccineum TaxID=301880 RepID=A0ABQ5AXH0_9ASTR
MEESLPTMVDDQVKELTKTQVPVYVAQGLIMERQQSQADGTKMILDAIQQERKNLRSEITSQINDAISNHIPSQVDSSVGNYMSGHILHVRPTQATPTSVYEQQQLYLTMRDNPQLQQDDLSIWLAFKYKFERLHVATTPCRPSAVRPRDQDDPHDDAHLEGENSAKRKKTSEHRTFVFEESSSGQDFESEQCPSTSGNQEQLDDYDFWTDSYATYDDEIPNEKLSQELVDEMSHTVNEEKLGKVVDEMLRQQCTSGDEHQYHIDQIQNFLKNNIKGNSGPKTIVMSLHKFPAVIFPDGDIEEITSRWVDKCVKKFNPYARYNVEHWKNPNAKIFYIKKQKELGKPKEVVYANSKIVQIIKTYWELGHEHKFITEIVARRANGSVVSITESDYKNLNKNDIEDVYLLIVNHKVDDYAETGLLWSLSVFIRSTVIWERVHDFQLGVESYQKKVNLIAPTITFPGIEKLKVFSIISEPVYGIIYKNNKKENKVMRYQEVHKFCDATLKRVLEGLKSYNNDVKHGYVTQSLSNEDVEYLQIFEEEIEERLKHHDQMRRWEMYMNGRPLGSRKEHP